MSRESEIADHALDFARKAVISVSPDLDIYRVSLTRTELEALTKFEKGFWGASLTYLNDINLVLNLTAASMNGEPSAFPEKLFWRRNREYMLRNIISTELEYDRNVERFEVKYERPGSHFHALRTKWAPEFARLRSDPAYDKARRIRNKAFSHHDISEYAKAMRDCSADTVFSLYAARGRSNSVSDIGVDLPWLVTFGASVKAEEIAELLDWSLKMAKMHEHFISDLSQEVVRICAPDKVVDRETWRASPENTWIIEQFRLPLLAIKGRTGSAAQNTEKSPEPPSENHRPHEPKSDT